MPPTQAPLEHLQIELARAGDLGPLETLLGEADLALRQEKGLGGVGDPGEQEEPREGHGYGDDAVDDEEPPPARHAADPGQVRVRRRLEVPADHGAERIADEPRAGSLE